jgi:hypothetical protein
MVLEAFVEGGVASEAIGETVQFIGAGEVAEDEELRGFDEGGFFGEFFDGDAAIAEDSFFAVDEGDGAGAAAGVSIGGIEGDEPGFGAEFGDVDGLFALGADDDGELVGFAVDGDGGGSADGLLLWTQRPAYLPTIMQFLQWAANRRDGSEGAADDEIMRDVADLRCRGGEGWESDLFSSCRWFRSSAGTHDSPAG